MNPWLEYSLWALFWTLIVTGVAGALLPIPLLPGPPLVVAAALLHRFSFPQTSPVSWTLLVVLTFLAILTLVLDTVTGAIGAKKFGGTRWGVLGAFAGALLGLVAGGPVGLLIGPPLGVFTAEYLALNDPKKAWRATQGALLGMILGTLGRSLVTLAMVALLLLQIFNR
ncbi:MAG: hypothetical protein RIS92_951 [Verrucomicrobiota bacterium]